MNWQGFIKKQFFPLSVLLIFSLCIPLVFADLGPKPTATIQLTYDGKSITEPFTAEMLSCGKPINSSDNCSWVHSNLAWSDCDNPDQSNNGTCTFTYMLPDHFKLRIYFPEKNSTYVSEPVERNAFNSEYIANIMPDGTIHVTETTPFTSGELFKSLPYLGGALLITMLLEGLAAYIFIRKRDIEKKFIVHVILLNIITFPLLWITVISAGTFLAFILAEIAVIVVEGGILALLHKDKPPILKYFTFSLIANLASIILGWIISAIITLVFVSLFGF